MKNKSDIKAKQKILDDYIKKYNIGEKVTIGFSIPEAYKYASQIGKDINDLSGNEISKFKRKS